MSLPSCRVGAAEGLDQEARRPPTAPGPPRPVVCLGQGLVEGHLGGAVGRPEGRVGSGLHGRHGGQADDGRHQGDRRRRDSRPVSPGPSPRPARRAARARPSPARRPPIARCRRPATGGSDSGRPDRSAIAFRQTASSARSIVGSTWRGGAELASLHAADHVGDVVAVERRLAGQQAVERRAEAVDVATAGRGGRGRPAACSGLM